MISKILVITRHYLDENNGGSNASKGYIAALASIFPDCSLIYPEKIGNDSSNFIPTSIQKFPCYDKRSKVKKGIDIYFGRLHRFTHFVQLHLSQHNYDVIIIDHSLTAASTIQQIKKTNAKIITIHHNVEAEYIKDNQPSWLYRIPYNYFSKKAEIDALLNSDINFTITQKDAKTFQSWYPTRNLHLYPIEICNFKEIQNISFPSASSKRNHVFVISGSLCFKQSIEPIVSFIKTYYPIMKRIIPDCKLIITGRNPSKLISALCQSDNSITLIPNPIDISSVIQKANYYICPIDKGSGLKLRVQDGLRLGLPVLCHEISTAGYESFIKKELIFKYHNCESFESTLNHMMLCNIEPNKIYAEYQHQFSKDSMIKKMTTVFKNEGLQ